MILGIGTDLIEIDRIAQNLQTHGQRFLDRIFTPTEQARGAALTSAEAQAAHYAKRFAAKEALVKALGTGFAQGISWQDVSIDNKPTGQPYMTCEKSAQEKLRALAPENHSVILHLSLSDTGAHAFAMVLVEARPLEYATSKPESPSKPVSPKE